MASAALPPSRSTRAPASTASGFAAATIQFSASTGVPASRAAIAAAAASESESPAAPAPVVAVSGATASAACCADKGCASAAQSAAPKNNGLISFLPNRAARVAPDSALTTWQAPPDPVGDAHLQMS
ncbi:hypothetical protein TM1040_0481 [Ruegeria sp. TM1040]|nr:hypothetical protein TM1040_0481 [Ruegeria sp. TM1040]